jgi:hypothetical protein
MVTPPSQSREQKQVTTLNLSSRPKRSEVEGPAVRLYLLSDPAQKAPRIQDPFRIKAALDLAHQR